MMEKEILFSEIARMIKQLKIDLINNMNQNTADLISQLRSSVKGVKVEHDKKNDFNDSITEMGKDSNIDLIALSNDSSAPVVKINLDESDESEYKNSNEVSSPEISVTEVEWDEDYLFIYTESSLQNVVEITASNSVDPIEMVSVGCNSFANANIKTSSLGAIISATMCKKCIDEQVNVTSDDIVNKLQEEIETETDTVFLSEGGNVRKVWDPGVLIFSVLSSKGL